MSLSVTITCLYNKHVGRLYCRAEFAASSAATWWVTVSKPMGQTERQTNRRTEPDRYITLSVVDAASVTSTYRTVLFFAVLFGCFTSRDRELYLWTTSVTVVQREVATRLGGGELEPGTRTSATKRCTATGQTVHASLHFIGGHALWCSHVTHGCSVSCGCVYITVIYGHDTISIGHDVMLCKVNWLRFVTLFK